MTIRHLVHGARARLAAAGIDPNEAAMDAELLAREALGWDRSRFLAHDTDPAPSSFAEAYEPLVLRRERREPISEILGRREFWGLDFEVTRDVLTPRPETEIVVEEALRRFGGSAPARIADVGTGSGCLAICLARAFFGETDQRPAPALRDMGQTPAAPSNPAEAGPREDKIIATDISAAALTVAARNAARHGVADRISFRLTSLLDGLGGAFELIVSNPPYVPRADIPGLPPEVRSYEPIEALDGGVDGLDVIRVLLRQAAPMLAPGGIAIVEFGFGQEVGVRQSAAAAGLEVLAVRADLQGIPRTLVAGRASG